MAIPIESLKNDLARLARACRAAEERREPMTKEIEDFAVAVAEAVAELPPSERSFVAEEAETAIAALNSYLVAMERERDAASDALDKGQSRTAVFSAYAKMQRIGGYGD